MGTITNNAAVGDGIGDVFVYGFETKEEAIRYAGSDLPLRPGNTKYQVELTRGQSLDFQDNPWFVFWHISGATDTELLMLAQCYGQLRLSLGSWGSQLLLSPDRS
ncbi:MAG: hypothetical protein MPN21_12825 [Thermoanaerobaculia bacterium]|nr:hypothetical protein [Thermoanaerobaculia bacterium]